jgi:hypothetical protein
VKCINAVPLTMLFFLTACSLNPRPAAIDYHEKTAPYVQIGMAEESFLKLMEPALDASNQGKYGRKPDRYSIGSDMYVVHFMRASMVDDGVVTDDEFQPYTFENGRLIAVGWNYLGGPKFTSQDLEKRRASAPKTEVKVQSNTSSKSKEPLIKPYCPPSKYPIYGCPPPTPVIIVD